MQSACGHLVCGCVCSYVHLCTGGVTPLWSGWMKHVEACRDPGAGFIPPVTCLGGTFAGVGLRFVICTSEVLTAPWISLFYEGCKQSINYTFD